MLRDGLNYYCIDCWAKIEPGLASLCSMRCHDCRDELTDAAMDDRVPEESHPVVHEGTESWSSWFVRTQGVPA